MSTSFLTRTQWTKVRQILRKKVPTRAQQIRKRKSSSPSRVQVALLLGPIWPSGSLHYWRGSMVGKDVVWSWQQPAVEESGPISRVLCGHGMSSKGSRTIQNTASFFWWSGPITPAGMINSFTCLLAL